MRKQKVNKDIIVLSIHKQHFDNIVKGVKKFEYRKTIPNHNIKEIYFYITYPVKMCLGKAKVEKILCNNLDDLWKETHQYSGIDKKFYLKYFENVKLNKCYAYQLKDVMLFNQPLELEFFDIKTPPQNFCYLPK